MVGINVYDVRSANQWLKKSGYGQLHVSSKKDSYYGKVYVLSNLNGTSSQEICSSPGLGEIMEQAVQRIRNGMVRRVWSNDIPCEITVTEIK